MLDVGYWMLGTGYWWIYNGYTIEIKQIFNRNNRNSMEIHRNLNEFQRISIYINSQQCPIVELK